MKDFRRSKDVDPHRHHVRENVQAHVVKIRKVPTREIIADFLTKQFSRV